MPRLRPSFYKDHLSGGFTLMELMMVITIIAIAAMMVVPMLFGAGQSKVKAAAERLMADLEMARSLAITYCRPFVVRFDPNGQPPYYQIEDQDGNVITHPITKGQYIVRFSDSLDGVRIKQVTFDGTAQVRFNWLGSPYNGNGQDLNCGLIRLEAGGYEGQIFIEPMTGLVRLEGL